MRNRNTMGDENIREGVIIVPEDTVIMLESERVYMTVVTREI